MGPKRQKPLKGPLTEGNTASKKQKQLVAAGLCRECGSPLGRAKTICDTCADKDAARLAAAAAADKAAERKEAEKNSPLLSARELKALPALATGNQKIKGVKERGNVSGAGGGVGGVALRLCGPVRPADPSAPCTFTSLPSAA
jgi:hypothetical protein